MTATDPSNNSDNCTATVTVVDNIAPTAVCQDKTVYLDANGQASITAADIDNGSSDNCSVSLSASQTTFCCDDVGTVEVILTATDPSGNSNSCTASVTVVNDKPEILDVTGLTNDPQALGYTVNLSFTFTDDNTETITLNWGDGTLTELDVEFGTNQISVSHQYADPGVYEVKISATDPCGLADEYVHQYIVIYDPSAGFVTGGGWIDSREGAYLANPSLTGKANFGFVAKYQKGKTVPDGNTEFQFKAGNLNFKSTDYEWLVISGAKAQFKGTGAINGTGNYGFILSAIDEALTPSTLIDLFRIKIWEISSGAIVYDNNYGVDDNGDPTTAIAGGSIVIHSADKKTKAAEIATTVEPIKVVEAEMKVYPNPFKDQARFEFVSPVATQAKIDIYDMAGRRIQTIFDGFVEENTLYNAEFKPVDQISGMYLYRMQLGDMVYNGKLVYKNE